MDKLSSSQLAAVAEWFAQGASLDEIQKRMSAEFGVHLTYLDVRLLVADLPQPVEPEEPRAEAPVEATPVPPAVDPAEAEVAAEGVPEEPPADLPPEEPPAGGELSVVVDPLAPPGAIACGSVTFSDGTTGKWMLDQMGRLGLSGLPQGYRPPMADNAQFQPKLVEALRAKGLV